MSILEKKWVIKNQNSKFNIIGKLLQNRGVDSPEKADWFFNGTLDYLHDPKLMKGMDKAVERIKLAIKNREKIMVFGDYDVDGITATAILYDFLKKNDADVNYTIPNREKDGYGLKDYFIKRFKEDDITLVITVDCGVSNYNEVKLANELGVDVIITDHHTIPKKLPDAYTIVNPQQSDCRYPNKDICGSSVAFKIVTVLANELWETEKAKDYLNSQLGLVALGIVGDCMALKGENRILVNEGLKRLESGKPEGVLALLKEAKIPMDKITSTTIGFQIGPRINAAGRIDDPKHAFELLIGDLDKAQVLNELNNKRKVSTKQYIEEAISDVENLKAIPNIIVLINKNWQSGLLGLIAGGISERYNRPTITMQDRGDKLVASMRSVNDFDITSNLRAVSSELFDAFGGHAMAGGFTLPKNNLDEFLKRVEEVGEDKINPEDFERTLNIDCEVESHELSFETCHKINRLEPFGADNPEPVLLLKNVTIQNIRTVGKNQEHLQLPIQHGDKTIGAIAFRFGEYLDKIDTKKPHDIVCNLEINEWNGHQKLQLRIVDLKPSENHLKTT